MIHERLTVNNLAGQTGALIRVFNATTGEYVDQIFSTEDFNRIVKIVDSHETSRLKKRGYYSRDKETKSKSRSPTKTTTTVVPEAAMNVPESLDTQETELRGMEALDAAPDDMIIVATNIPYTIPGITAPPQVEETVPVAIPKTRTRVTKVDEPKTIRLPTMKKKT